MLQIAYAGLDDTALNAMLLDLARLLEEHNVAWNDPLAGYLELRHTDCPEGEAEGDCGQPAFVLPEDEIVYWQSKGVFSLQDKPGDATWDDDLVKTDPAVFYDYLLYKRFKIEDPKADGQRYSQADAWRIMGLRYLLYENNWAFINGTPLELARHVAFDLVQIINEQNYRYMGVIATTDYERAYTDAASALSHVLGYVGPISARQYDTWRSLGYGPDDIVGYAGVELSAERFLAGQDGIRPYNIWSVAGEAGAFYPETIGRAALPAMTSA